MTTTSSAASPASHTSGGDSLWRWIATSPPSQKTPPIAAARSSSCLSSGTSAAIRACTASCTRERELHAGELLRVDAPALVLEVVGDLEDAAVVVDADHLLEERRVAPGERHRRVDQLLDLGGFAARREEIVHHGRRLGVAERGQLDRSVPVAAAAPPAVASGQHLGARQADEEHGPAEALDEVREQLERVVVRPLQVVEHQDERVADPCWRRSRGSS